MLRAGADPGDLRGPRDRGAPHLAPPPPWLRGGAVLLGILARKGVSVRKCVCLRVDARGAGFWKGRGSGGAPGPRDSAHPGPPPPPSFGSGGFVGYRDPAAGRS